MNIGQFAFRVLRSLHDWMNAYENTYWGRHNAIDGNGKAA
jgi:hypothetical protein